MKRGKKLLVLLAALAVLGAVAFSASRYTAALEAEEETTAVTVFSVDSQSVTALSWTCGGETVSLDCADGQWHYTGSDACPIDQSYPQAMVEALAEIVSREAAIQSPEDLADYGLEEPQCTVSLTAGGADHQLLIGDETVFGGEVYLSTGDGDVYVVDEALLTAFSYGLYDIVQMEEIPAMEDVSVMSVEAETGSLELRYMPDSGLTYSVGDVWFLRDGEGWLALDTDGAEALVETVTGLSWQSCVSYDASEEDLAEYGLDEPAATVTLTYVASEEDEEGESRSWSETFALEIGGYSGESCYARLAGSGMVYLIDAAVSDSMLYTAYADLLPGQVLSMDWDTVTSIDVTVDGATYTVTRQVTAVTDEDGQESQEVTYLLEGAQVDFDSLLDGLDDLATTGSALDAVPERSALVSFTFHRSAEDFPQVELTIYQYDSASCLVQLDGRVMWTAARADGEALAETAGALAPGA